MSVDLPPQLETAIRARVDSGEYPDAAAVIAEAMRLLQERDDLRQLRAAIQIGIDELERGEGIPFTDEFHDQMIERALARAKAGERPGPDVLP